MLVRGCVSCVSFLRGFTPNRSVNFRLNVANPVFPDPFLFLPKNELEGVHTYNTELKVSTVPDDSESACGRTCLLDLHVSTINDGRAQADKDLEERMPID